MPCKPLQLNVPDGPSGPAIPGFGVPFALKTPDLKVDISPFPENLLELLDKLEFLIPPGKLKPQLSRNSGKDPFDAIMKLMDQFLPFLMGYKFFLPVLNLIICIIEVLCYIPNPFKISKALTKLFRQCIPQFLNLFPVFAFIIMIISLLLLLLALIEYIREQVVKLCLLIVKQYNMLAMAYEKADEKSILAIARKIGSILCYFQQLMVLLSIFTSTLQTIKEMLSLLFAIPPCDNNSDCCTPDVCPTIVKAEYTRTTGKLLYLNKVVETTDIGVATLYDTLREETWQIYDNKQEELQAFINIVDAADVPSVPGETKFIFFPTDATYSKDTSPQQAPYTVDIRFFYEPAIWDRKGLSRYVRIKNCIVLSVPKRYSSNYENNRLYVTNGVLSLAGGTVYEDDGVTIIPGFDDGLNSFLHKPAIEEPNPVLLPTDGYTYTNLEYKFKPNQPVLLSKNLITSGCLPDVAKNKDFFNTVVAGDIALKLALVNAIPLPDTNGAQDCILNAADKLSQNLTNEAIAEFQATVLTCLDKLELETIDSLKELINTGFDPCKSLFSLEPRNQFTTQPIKVLVTINDANGLNLASNIPEAIASDLAMNIKAHVSVGKVSEFIYDGSSKFIANWTSENAGIGTIMISFQNQIFCTNNIPEDINEDASRELQELKGQFIYAPSGGLGSEGDPSEGIIPRRGQSSDSVDMPSEIDPNRGEEV